jgi:hypothetical protein
MRRLLAAVALIFCCIEAPSLACADDSLLNPIDSVTGVSFAVIEAAMPAFEQKLPRNNVEDYVISVYRTDTTFIVVFTNKNEPPLKEGEMKAGSALLELNVTVSKDSKAILDAAFSL